MTAWLLFVLGISSLMATASALIRFRHPAHAGFMVMMAGWLTGEYPLFHFVAQAVAAAVLIGGADRPLGAIGLVALGLSLIHI